MTIPRPLTRKAFAPLKSVHAALFPVCAAAALACALMAPGASHAQVITNSSLYYRLGGSSPSGGALNRSQVALRLGLTLRLNYSCGKFDIGLSWTNLMNNIKQLGEEVDQAIQAGIAALPMYIMERAQIGLYQLFQTYSAKASLLTSAALKTCEEMEREIKNHQDPYEEYIDMAKNMAWKLEANGMSIGGSLGAGGDIVQAKANIDANEEGQKAGIPWVFGVNAGGAGQSPIRPIHDLMTAGYQAVGNQPPTTGYDTSANLQVTAYDARLAQAFGSADAAANWATQVLGDKDIYTCSQTDSNCPQPNDGLTASGLGPRLQDEINYVQPLLQQALTDPTSYSSTIAAISVPGFAISTQLMDAIREMPNDKQTLAMGRLTSELAMHRVVNKALITRNILLTGMSIPQAAKATQLQQDLQIQLERLTRYIDDLMYEWRIRKEMTGETASTIMNDAAFEDSVGRFQQPGMAPEAAPLVNGRVPNGNGQ